MLTQLDIDDALPNYSPSLLEQWKDGKGMIRSALQVGLTVGCAVGIASVCIAAVYTSTKEKVERG